MYEEPRRRYLKFIESCLSPEGRAHFTPRSDQCPYAQCFAIFGLNLLGKQDVLNSRADQWGKALRQSLHREREERRKHHNLMRDKPWLQLLTFTLSALSILGTLDEDPLGDYVRPMIPPDIDEELRSTGVFEGRPRTGNHAMFHGILLIHARDYLGMDTSSAISSWVSLHLENMNRFGFWGKVGSMSHLQFQNGYHQYELLEYLGIHEAPWEKQADHVAGLADSEGHFAPWPGGGGCYDYDAVFLLTGSPGSSKKHQALLKKTRATILAEQNQDGGFCESLYVRPRSLANVGRSFRHVLKGRGKARRERLRQSLTLLRSKYDHIETHWGGGFRRGWSESDLWDSWFRMLAIARIDVALNPDAIENWGFIDYPGIGYHPLAGRSLSARAADLPARETYTGAELPG